MSAGDLDCRAATRRAALRKPSAIPLTGLDYLEIARDPPVVTVTFFGRAPEGIRAENFLIEGGQRVTGLKVVDARWQEDGADDTLALVLDRAGDFSPYVLRLVQHRESDRTRLAGIDPHYDALPFTFRVDCPAELDCKSERPCDPPAREGPSLDYLAKDYPSFRQLMLDRLALVMPEWREAHAADLGITLVELLAFVGDYLSYYQDAVATEAYLGTARQRISVKRHAKLVDYVLHEGCNARAWVAVETSDDVTLATADVAFVTRYAGAPAAGTVLVENAAEEVPPGRDLAQVPPDGYEVFLPVEAEEGETLRFKQAHNEVRLYGWLDGECCLPKGATRATLVDAWVLLDRKPPPAGPRPSPPPSPRQAGPASPAQHCPPEEPPAPELGRALAIAPGDVLVLEEIVAPKTGRREDADRDHRQAVRVVRVTPAEDPLDEIAVEGTDARRPRPLLEIEWAEEDALSFPLCISALGPPPKCEILDAVSVARGNVVLVDHGRAVQGESLGLVPTVESRPTCLGPGDPSSVERVPGPFRPSLARRPLTYRAPLPRAAAGGFAPASVMLDQDPRQALPVIALSSQQRPEESAEALAAAATSDPPRRGVMCGKCGARAEIAPPARAAASANPAKGAAAAPECPACHAPIEPLIWTVRTDLLASGPDDADFVVEIDNGRKAFLRFGDGDLGRRPSANAELTAAYRIGSGPRGNVGAEAIAFVATRHLLDGVALTPRNPLPARGGAVEEPLGEAKLLAPGSIRSGLERAIVAEDYARIAESRPARPGDRSRARLSRAAAGLFWNGSWYEALVTLDPLGKSRADEALIADVERLLQRYRRIGHDLRAGAARSVALHLAMSVCVKPSYLRAAVKAALLDVFSSRNLPGGKRGFFHPDDLTFGEGIYLGRVVAAAQAVAGVELVQITRLERVFEAPNGELESGLLSLGPLEIARLDNDPTNPENGMLTLTLRGGR